MLAVIDLVLPLFGLIFLGYLTAKLVRIPYAGLAWMNTFIIYVALPALFYQLLSKTPVQQFSNIGFIAVSIFATFIIFCLVFFLARGRNRNKMPEATIQGLAAAYGNIGYLGGRRRIEKIPFFRPGLPSRKHLDPVSISTMSS